MLSSCSPRIVHCSNFLKFPKVFEKNVGLFPPKCPDFPLNPKSVVAWVTRNAWDRWCKRGFRSQRTFCQQQLVFSYVEHLKANHCEAKGLNRDKKNFQEEQNRKCCGRKTDPQKWIKKKIKKHTFCSIWSVLNAVNWCVSLCVHVCSLLI